MNKSIIVAAALFISAPLLNAQEVQEVVSISAGYTDEVWYSLEAGEQGRKNASDWDLAFNLTGYGTSIRVNNGNGILVYPYPNGNISDWASVDTTGMSNWNAVYNSELSWELGALDQGINPNDPFDVGWGIYNQNTHVVSGDSIFVIKLMDDSYRKLRIDNMASGAFNFTFANLDGTNEVQASVTKADYTNKLFGYYSIQNESSLDHEPAAITDWDLFFGKYTGFIPTPYNLTGIITAPHIEVAQVEGVADVSNYNEWYSTTFTTEINTIGADWKEFDFGTMSYLISDDLVYFVKTQTGDIWKIVPTGFGGSSSGNFEFTKEKISMASIGENTLTKPEVIIYPNPASSNISLILNNMLSNSTTIQILCLNGQVVFEQEYEGKSDFEVKNISLNNIMPGVYFVNAVSGDEQLTQKLIIK